MSDVPPPPVRALPPDLDPADEPLYDALRNWRRRVAAARGQSPYFVLPNRALAAIAQARPADLDALRAVKGIGPAKSDLYGAAILAVVRSPEDERPPEVGLVPVTALLLAARYEVELAGANGLVARPAGGGPALAITLAEGA